MDVKRLDIPDVKLFTASRFLDHRGSFFEAWNQEWDAEIPAFTGTNISTSKAWTLRGLHYQIEEPQGKLVRCLGGKVYDVAVDMRRPSPTFGKWIGVLLENPTDALWVPPGFAHGFMAVAHGATVLYQVTGPHHPGFDRTLIWNDPDVGVEWPLGKASIILSEKDRNGAPFSKAEVYR